MRHKTCLPMLIKINKMQLWRKIIALKSLTLLVFFFFAREKKPTQKRPWALGRLQEAETSWWAERRTRGQRCFQRPLCGTHLRLTIFKKIKLTSRSTVGHGVTLASQLGKDTRAVCLSALQKRKIKIASSHFCIPASPAPPTACSPTCRSKLLHADLHCFLWRCCNRRTAGRGVVSMTRMMISTSIVMMITDTQSNKKNPKVAAAIVHSAMQHCKIAVLSQ